MNHSNNYRGRSYAARGNSEFNRSRYAHPAGFSQPRSGQSGSNNGNRMPPREGGVQPWQSSEPPIQVWNNEYQQNYRRNYWDNGPHGHYPPNNFPPNSYLDQRQHMQNLHPDPQFNGANFDRDPRTVKNNYYASHPAWQQQQPNVDFDIAQSQQFPHFASHPPPLFFELGRNGPPPGFCGEEPAKASPSLPGPPKTPPLGSEEERRKKISAAADKLKQSLSAITSANNDDDCENFWEDVPIPSSSPNEETCVTTKAIPDLKHDPPELDLTSNDLKNIGRIDNKPVPDIECIDVAEKTSEPQELPMDVSANDDDDEFFANRSIELITNTTCNATTTTTSHSAAAAVEEGGGCSTKEHSSQITSERDNKKKEIESTNVALLKSTETCEKVEKYPADSTNNDFTQDGSHVDENALTKGGSGSGSSATLAKVNRENDALPSSTTKGDTEAKPESEKSIVEAREIEAASVTRVATQRSTSNAEKLPAAVNVEDAMSSEKKKKSSGNNSDKAWPGEWTVREKNRTFMPSGFFNPHAPPPLSDNWQSTREKMSNVDAAVIKVPSKFDNSSQQQQQQHQAARDSWSYQRNSSNMTQGPAATPMCPPNGSFYNTPPPLHRQPFINNSYTQFPTNSGGYVDHYADPATQGQPPNAYNNQVITPHDENVHIPRAFDPRLSTSERNAAMYHGPPDVGDGRQMGGNGPPPAIGMMQPPPVNAYMPPPMGMAQPPGYMPMNYPPAMHCVPTADPAAMYMQSPMVAPPLPPASPPPMTEAKKESSMSQENILECFEEMQEALEFAKIMNMTDQPSDNASVDPNSPAVPPLPVPVLLTEGVKDKAKKESPRKSKERKKKPQNVPLGPQPLLSPLYPKSPVASQKSPIIAFPKSPGGEGRTKVAFNLNAKSKVISTPSQEWQQEPEEEEAQHNTAERLMIAEQNRLAAQKKSSPEKTDKKEVSKKLAAMSHQLEERDKLKQKSRSPSPRRLLSRRKSDESLYQRNVFSKKTAKKEDLESSWKSRVISRFLKMSKNDICNMVNNSSLRKFDIAMKHLVKEQKTTMSLEMRNNEDDKIRDYDREEFMNQLNAMLDPSATVDITNLPTEFIHHLNAVLQLDVGLDEGTGEFGDAQGLSDAIFVPETSTTFLDSRLAADHQEATPGASTDHEVSLVHSSKQTASSHRDQTTTRHKQSTSKVHEVSSSRHKKTTTLVHSETDSTEQLRHKSRHSSRDKTKQHNRPPSPVSPAMVENIIHNEARYMQHLVRKETPKVNPSDIDDIFLAGIAKTKAKKPLASKNTLHGGVEGNNFIDLDELLEMSIIDGSDLRYRKSLADDRSNEAFDGRKKREGPDTYRNLTKEEWEERYGGGSFIRRGRVDYMHEDLRGRLNQRGNQRGCSSADSSSSRLNNKPSTSENPSDWDADSRQNSSDSSSDSDSSSSDSSDSYKTSPDVTRLLKMIKEREKAGKSRTLNEVIREDVVAEIEQRRREKRKQRKRDKHKRERKKKKKHRRHRSDERLDQDALILLNESKIKKEFAEMIDDNSEENWERNRYLPKKDASVETEEPELPSAESSSSSSAHKAKQSQLKHHALGIVDINKRIVSNPPPPSPITPSTSVHHPSFPSALSKSQQHVSTTLAKTQAASSSMESDSALPAALRSHQNVSPLKSSKPVDNFPLVKSYTSVSPIYPIPGRNTKVEINKSLKCESSDSKASATGSKKMDIAQYKARLQMKKQKEELQRDIILDTRTTLTEDLLKIPFMTNYKRTQVDETIAAKTTTSSYNAQTNDLINYEAGSKSSSAKPIIKSIEVTNIPTESLNIIKQGYEDAVRQTKQANQLCEDKTAKSRAVQLNRRMSRSTEDSEGSKDSNQVSNELKHDKRSMSIQQRECGSECDALLRNSEEAQQTPRASEPCSSNSDDATEGLTKLSPEPAGYETTTPQVLSDEKLTRPPGIKQTLPNQKSPSNSMRCEDERELVIEITKINRVAEEAQSETQRAEKPSRTSATRRAKSAFAAKKASQDVDKCVEDIARDKPEEVQIETIVATEKQVETSVCLQDENKNSIDCDSSLNREGTANVQVAGDGDKEIAAEIEANDGKTVATLAADGELKSISMGDQTAQITNAENEFNIAMKEEGMKELVENEEEEGFKGFPRQSTLDVDFVETISDSNDKSVQFETISDSNDKSVQFETSGGMQGDNNLQAIAEINIDSPPDSLDLESCGNDFASQPMHSDYKDTDPDEDNSLNEVKDLYGKEESESEEASQRQKLMDLTKMELKDDKLISGNMSEDEVDHDLISIDGYLSDMTDSLQSQSRSNVGMSNQKSGEGYLEEEMLGREISPLDEAIDFEQVGFNVLSEILDKDCMIQGKSDVEQLKDTEQIGESERIAPSVSELANIEQETSQDFIEISASLQFGEVDLPQQQQSLGIEAPELPQQQLLNAEVGETAGQGERSVTQGSDVFETNSNYENKQLAGTEEFGIVYQGQLALAEVDSSAIYLASDEQQLNVSNEKEQCEVIELSETPEVVQVTVPEEPVVIYKPSGATLDKSTCQSDKLEFNGEYSVGTESNNKRANDEPGIIGENINSNHTVENNVESRTDMEPHAEFKLKQFACVELEKLDVNNIMTRKTTTMSEPEKPKLGPELATVENPKSLDTRERDKRDGKMEKALYKIKDKPKMKSKKSKSHLEKNTEKLASDVGSSGSLLKSYNTKESVMARMVQIDMEIHKLMSEKMTLYQLMQSGTLPSVEDDVSSELKETDAESDVEVHEIQRPKTPAVLMSEIVMSKGLDTPSITTPSRGLTKSLDEDAPLAKHSSYDKKSSKRKRIVEDTSDEELATLRLNEEKRKSKLKKSSGESHKLSSDKKKHKESKLTFKETPKRHLSESSTDEVVVNIKSLSKTKEKKFNISSSEDELPASKPLKSELPKAHKTKKHVRITSDEESLAGDKKKHKSDKKKKSDKDTTKPSSEALKSTSEADLSWIKNKPSKEKKHKSEKRDVDKAKKSSKPNALSDNESTAKIDVKKPPPLSPKKKKKAKVEESPAPVPEPLTFSKGLKVTVPFNKKPADELKKSTSKRSEESVKSSEKRESGKLSKDDTFKRAVPTEVSRKKSNVPKQQDKESGSQVAKATPELKKPDKVSPIYSDDSTLEPFNLVSQNNRLKGLALLERRYEKEMAEEKKQKLQAKKSKELVINDKNSKSEETTSIDKVIDAVAAIDRVQGMEISLDDPQDKSFDEETAATIPYSPFNSTEGTDSQDTGAGKSVIRVPPVNPNLDDNAIDPEIVDMKESSSTVYLDSLKLVTSYTTTLADNIPNKSHHHDSSSEKPFKKLDISHRDKSSDNSTDGGTKKSKNKVFSKITADPKPAAKSPREPPALSRFDQPKKSSDSSSEAKTPSKPIKLIDTSTTDSPLDIRGDENTGANISSDESMSSFRVKRRVRKSSLRQTPRKEESLKRPRSGESDTRSDRTTPSLADVDLEYGGKRKKKKSNKKRKHEDRDSSRSRSASVSKSFKRKVVLPKTKPLTISCVDIRYTFLRDATVRKQFDVRKINIPKKLAKYYPEYYASVKREKKLRQDQQAAAALQKKQAEEEAVIEEPVDRDNNSSEKQPENVTQQNQSTEEEQTLQPVQMEVESSEEKIAETEAPTQPVRELEEASSPKATVGDSQSESSRAAEDAEKPASESEIERYKSDSNEAEDESSQETNASQSDASATSAEELKMQYTVHKGPVLDIKVLSDSFLAASEDGTIYRYSQTSNGILNIYKGHKSAVTCLYVHNHSAQETKESTDKKVYSGSLDRTLRCYNISTSLETQEAVDIGSPIQCMDQAWGFIYIGTKSGCVSRFHVKSGSVKGESIQFSDKSVLALRATNEGARRVLIVASRNQPITIRDAQTGLLIRTISGHTSHTVYSLLMKDSQVYCGTSSTSIPVFDFITGEQIMQYNAGVGIVCMKIYNNLLFAGCYDGNIYIFDLKDKKLMCSIAGPGSMLLSLEILGEKIIAGSRDKKLHAWLMPKQVRDLLTNTR